MKKTLRVCMTLPVTIEVEADNSTGEVEIIDVCNVDLPSLADVEDSMSEGNLEALDEAFNAS